MWARAPATRPRLNRRHEATPNVPRFLMPRARLVAETCRNGARLTRHATPPRARLLRPKMSPDVALLPCSRSCTFRASSFRERLGRRSSGNHVRATRRPDWRQVRIYFPQLTLKPREIDHGSSELALRSRVSATKLSGRLLEHHHDRVNLGDRLVQLWAEGVHSPSTIRICRVLSTIG